MYLIMIYTIYLRYLYMVEVLKKKFLRGNESLIGQYVYLFVCII